MTENTKSARPRGFAAMDPAKVREISSKGGKAAHAAGTAHTFTAKEASDAGRKGGVAPHVRRGRGPASKPPPSQERERRTDDGTYPNVGEERAKNDERAKAGG